MIAIVFGGRLSNQSVFPFLFFLQPRYNLKIFFCMVSLWAIKGGMTSAVSTTVFLGFYLVNNRLKANFRVFSLRVMVFGIVVSCVLLLVIFSKFQDFYRVGYDIFETDLDRNAIWRLMLWSYLLSTRFIYSPLCGIGFGTKLLDREDTDLFWLGSPDDTHLEYTLGTHNSFLFVLIRFGIVGIIPLVMIYRLIFEKPILEKEGYNIRLASAHSFLFISNSAAFNVILESPLYAGTFWILLGIFVESFRKPNGVLRRSCLPEFLPPGGTGHFARKIFPGQVQDGNYRDGIPRKCSCFQVTETLVGSSMVVNLHEQFSQKKLQEEAK